MVWTMAEQKKLEEVWDTGLSIMGHWQDIALARNDHHVGPLSECRDRGYLEMWSFGSSSYVTKRRLSV